jgi:hypothetical protein
VVDPHRQALGAKIAASGEPAVALAPTQELARHELATQAGAEQVPPVQSLALTQAAPAREPPTQVWRQSELPMQLLPASMPPEHEEPQSLAATQAWFTLAPPEQKWRQSFTAMQAFPASGPPTQVAAKPGAAISRPANVRERRVRRRPAV